MTIFINPGSGPVEDATAKNAADNVHAFAEDLRCDGHDVAVLPHLGPDDGTGRFTFKLVVDGVSHEVAMPGLTLDRVRFMDSTEQNIWDFPRLYVDGSSWVWCFALGAAASPDEGDDQ